MRGWHFIRATLAAHFTAAGLFFRGSSLRHARHERRCDHGEQKQESRDFCQAIHEAS